MKKLLSLALIFLLLIGALPGLATASATNGDDVKPTEPPVMLDVTPGSDNYAQATKANPAPIRSTVLYKENSFTGNEYTLQVTHVVAGKAAAAVIKSFNRYNPRLLDKNEEWVMIRLHVEALASDYDKVELNDYYFKLVSKDGVEYESPYISGNPDEVMPLYVGSQEDAWIVAAVKTGDQPVLTYRTFTADETAWFDLTKAVPFQGDEIQAESLGKDDTGDDVYTLQMLLLELGFFQSLPTSEYDRNTIIAVKDFQKNNRLEPTGTADADTLAKLLSNKAVRAPQK